MRRVLLTLVGFVVVVSAAFGGPQAITYQASLTDNLGNPMPTRLYIMRFRLYATPTGGTQVWQEQKNVQATGGVFSTTLGELTPFGGLFMDYPELYLEVAVDTNVSLTLDSNEIFTPRQRLFGAPWATRLVPNSLGPNLIGGWSGNAIAPGVVGGTIAGGGAAKDGMGSLAPNRVTDGFGFVGGGTRNRAGNNTGTTTDSAFAVVCGGTSNTASDDYSFVGGGRGNRASNPWTTIAGGDYNTASGYASAVAGGQGNEAGGYWSVVPGGTNNVASGDRSLAAGSNASAEHEGCFVWADRSMFGHTFRSTASNQFSARAQGGVRFVTAIDGSGNPTAGVQVAAGGTGWSAISDRNRKENFVSVDTKALVARLAAIPIETWNLKSQDPSIRHIGPTAQDFRAAFQVGEDSLHINSIDADGVALAAIQGLYKAVQDKDARIATLETRLAELESLVARLSKERASGQ